MIINLSNIYFGYNGDSPLLKDLNFALRKGDRIGIIGPNGCGKTTLLYLIMGLLKPQAGAVEIFGKKRLREDDFTEVREKIGFLFQNSDDQLFCPSVREEVAFGPLNFGKRGKEVENIVDESLGSVGLESFKQRVPYHLSGGEKRRLAMATILAMKPRVLLLDEPTLGLDLPTVEKIVEILGEPGLAYIIISQNRDFLKRTTRQLITFEDGTLKTLD
ncbi:MAG: energy-coupling factor ABC transporter ATP-binding protein [candidate division WOR-3 bacterium]|nr:energy-coupling factor ABC transporter ATP-binding protein [candidate division WOR-3 bacterium]